MTAQERDAQRRRQLAEAALELFGTQGWNGTSVQALCRQAGVPLRAFYELYDGRETLFLELYDSLVERSLADMTAAVLTAHGDLESQARAGFGAIVAAYDEDPRVARVVMVEVNGISAAVEAHRREALDRFSAVVTGLVEGLAGRGLASLPTRADLAAAAIVGAVTELLVGRASRAGGATRDELVETMTQLFLATFGPA